MIQNTPMIDVGGLIPLNVNLFVSVNIDFVFDKFYLCFTLFILLFLRILDNEVNLFLHNDVVSIYGLKMFLCGFI